MSQNETIEFACPNCNMDLKVPSHLAGVTGPCPHCHTSITAPTPIPAAPQAAPVAVAAPVSVPTDYQQPAQYPQAQPPAEPQPTPPQNIPQPIPSAEATPQPVQQQDAPLHRDASTAEAQTEQNKIPLSSSLQPTGQSNHGRRKIWPGIVFPALFLALAAVVVYLILDLMGILKFGKDTVEKAPPLETASSSSNHGPQINPTLISKPVSEPVLEDPTFEDPAITEPISDPIAPDPGPILHDPQDINKPGEVPDGLPDLATNDAPSLKEGNEAIKQRTAAVDEARQTLKRFLRARNFEEREPFLTKSSLKKEELIASCLGKPLPDTGEPTLRIIRERDKDRSLEAFFSVDFDQPDENRRKIVLIRMISYSESEPLLIHIDPFVDLFDERIKKFAKKPVEGTRTFHSLIEYSQFCFDEIPRQSTMATISFYPNQADSGSPLTKAYLSHESKAYKNLRNFAKAGDRVPSTLSVSWDTTTDPTRPFLEVIRLEDINWSL